MVFNRRIKLVAIAAAVAGFALIPASSASAVDLQGPWDKFDRCPVDDPAILAVQNGGNGCISSNSPHGTFKIGATTVRTGNTNLQFAAWGPGLPNVVGATLVSDPVKIPGGLLGLMCPAGAPPVTEICELIADNGLNRVDATVELAGQASDFSLFAAASGGTIVTLPLKIHLENVLLGPSCYIGSEADPIVLQPRQEPLATGITFEEDPLGSEADFITATSDVPVSQVDDAFAVPAATGCGILPGLLDFAVNAKQGLPSPAGANRLELNEADSRIVGNAPTGQQLSDAWHAAVIPGT